MSSEPGCRKTIPHILSIAHTIDNDEDITPIVASVRPLIGLSTTHLGDLQQLKMAVWRTLLRLSTNLYDTGDVQAIDATGFDRHSTSRHYANRTDYTFKSVKTTALVAYEISTVLDIHCSTK